MEEGKFVNEQNYKKGQDFIRKIRKILIIVGLVLIAGGATLLTFGIIKQNSVSMGESGWFDTSSAGMGMCFGGGVMLMFGLACFIYALVATIYAHKREIMAYEASATMPVAGEVIEKGAPIVGGAIGGVVKEVRKGWKEGGESSSKEIVCKKCGYKNDKTDKFCGGCGEKLEQKSYCPSCGAQVKKTDKFCSECGSKIE